MTAVNVEVDVAIVGAGVVGLAAAAELSKDGSVAVLERHEGFGRENSSHNSGVVHAGVYYPPGWLKTALCIEGNRLLYEWCEEHGVRVRRSGKLIIATDERGVCDLDRLLDAAAANGVPNLRRVDERDIARIEPSIRAVAGIHCGSSGVVDQMGLMKSFLHAAAERGAHVVYRHCVSALERREGGFVLTGEGPAGEKFSLSAGRVVNCAGLSAERIGRLMGYEPGGGPGNPPFRQCVNRGCYYDVAGAAARGIRHLAYPVPHADRSGLGVHLTIDIDGGAHLGPDTEWLGDEDALDFRSRDEHREKFFRSARKYLPHLKREDLAPGQVGYRPKLQRPGGPPQDFLIWHDRGYMHLGGIESPGLTASLAIARRVRRLLKGEAPIWT